MFGIKYINKSLCAFLLMLVSYSAKAQFTASFSVNDSIVCIGSTVSFTDLSSGYTGSIVTWAWDFGDAGTSGLQNPTHTYVSGGIKTVTLTVTDAASQVRTVQHNVYVLEAIANPNIIHICSPTSTTTMFANAPIVAGVTGNWFTPSSATIATPLNDTTQVGNLISGTYIFFWVLTDGTCSDADQVTVIVDNPVAANAGPDKQVCVSTASTTMAATNAAPGTGMWTTTSGATIANPASPTTAITGLNTVGTYTFVWTVTNISCVSSDTINIVVNATVTANAGTDQAVCSNPGTATLNAGTPALGSGVWTTTSGATITNPTSVNATVSGLTTAGTYNFIWTVTNGACNARDTMSIVVSQFRASNAGNDLQVCTTTGVATLNGNNPAPGTGLWTTTSTATIAAPASASTGVSGLNVAGFYYFVWTITNGSCVSRDTMVIIVRAPTTSVVGADQNLCNATSTTISGNVPAFGVGTWSTTSTATITSPSSATTTVNNLPIGNSAFIWTITLGACISRDTLIVHVDQLVVSNAGPDQQLCNLNNTTLAGNNPAPGTGTWTTTTGATITTPSSPTSTVTGLSAGTYDFVWTIVNGTCTSRDTVRVTVSNLIVSNAGADQQICSSTGNTTLSANTPASGSGLWTTTSSATITSPSNPASAVTGLTTAGNYSFMWTITNGACVSRDTVVVTVNAFVISNAGPDQQLCSSSSSTTLAGNNPASGSGTWTTTSGATITTPSSPTSTITGLTAGTYNLVWTIINGTCTSRDTIRITVDSLITANAGADQQICSGTGNTTLSANTPASGNGLWTTTSSATITSPSNPASAVTGLTTAGNYSFVWTITNGACVSRDTVVVTVNAFVISNAGPDQQLCSSSSSTTLAGNNPASGTGTWTTTSGATITTPSSPTSTVTGLAAGVYDFVWTIVNGTCTSRDTIRITVDSLITANAGADQQICSGTGNTTLSANTPASGIGLWTTTSSATITSPANPASAVTGLTTAGNYLFTWTITNGSCISTDTIIISVDSSDISNAGPDQQICELSDSTTLSANTPIAGTGTWTTTSTAVISNINDPNTTVSGLTAGSYSFVWTITNGSCISSDTVIILSDAVPTIANAGSDQNICAGTLVTLNGNSPVVGSGNWNTNSGATINNPTSPSAIVTALNPGASMFIWSISNGNCSSADTMIVYTNLNPSANAGSDAFTTSGTPVVIGGSPSATGGTSPYSYSWNPGTFLDDSTLANPTSTALVTTVYTLTVTDSMGCNAIDTVTVYVNSPPTANNDTIIINEDSIVVILPLLNDVDPDTNINIGSLVILNGPYAGAAIVITDSIIYTPAPNYFGTDSIQYAICDSGLPVYCDTAWIYLTILPLNDAPVATDDYVNTPEDSCVTINALANDTDVENNLDPSSFVIVTNPLHGTITPDSIAGQLIYCPDSSFNGADTIMYAVCDSGMPVLCDTAFIFITILPVNNMPVATNDTVEICSSDSIIVSILNNDFDIDGDTVTASIIGMPQHGNAAMDSAYNIGYGPTPGFNGTDTITYLICDNSTPSLCDTGYVLITVHSNPLLTAVTTGIKCFGDSIGAIDLTVNGYAPFTYSWNTTDTIEDVDSLIAGVYQVIVTDSNSCASTLIDSITGPALPLAATSLVQQVYCFGDSSGYIQLIVSGGTSPYYYLWNNADTTSVIDSLLPGIYSVTVTDTNGCSATYNDTITQPPSPLSATSLVNNIICFGDSTGSISLNVTGGTMPYQYNWNSGDTTNLNDSLMAGIYTVQIIDSNGCSLSLNDTVIHLNSVITYNVTTVQPQCLNGVTGSISTSVTGGISPYQYLWNTIDTVSSIDSLQAGNYSLIISDSAGCTVTTNILLADSSYANLIISGDNAFCSGDSVLLTGSYYSNSIYQWFVDTIAINTIDSNNYTTLSGGNYYFSLTNTCGTFTSSSITVTENLPPIIAVTDDLTVRCDSSIVLSVSGSNSYQWFPSSGLDNPSSATPVSSLGVSTQYFVIATDANGCSVTDSVSITVTCDSLEVPNGFSPNGDNVNDFFVISHIFDYPGNRLDIYNRWGNLIYHKDDYDNTWNGLSNVDIVKLGAELTDGTYFYVLDLNNGEARSGYVILRR